MHALARARDRATPRAPSRTRPPRRRARRSAGAHEPGRVGMWRVRPPRGPHRCTDGAHRAVDRGEDGLHLDGSTPAADLTDRLDATDAVAPRDVDDEVDGGGQLE